MLHECTDAPCRYRELYWPDFPDHLVTKRFILGRPPLPPHPEHPNAVEWARIMREMEEENQQYGDMVILDVRRVVPVLVFPADWPST